MQQAEDGRGLIPIWSTCRPRTSRITPVKKTECASSVQRLILAASIVDGADNQVQRFRQTRILWMRFGIGQNHCAKILFPIVLLSYERSLHVCFSHLSGG